jgi:hypothetical protein
VPVLKDRYSKTVPWNFRFEMLRPAEVVIFEGQ